jgi:hypothetical protein
MVSAETAMALPGLVAVLALVLWGVAVGVTHLRCVSAARAAAIALARGEDSAATAARTVRAVGGGVTLSVSRAADHVTVVVRTRVSGGLLPARVVTATATAVSEPAGSAGRAGDPRGGDPTGAAP